MDTRQKIGVLNTMASQMGICGITQGYLEVRGLKYVVANPENFELNLKLNNNVTISLRYNEGLDLYEVEVFRNFKLVYRENRIFCEDWKNVFNRIWGVLITN